MALYVFTSTLREFLSLRRAAIWIIAVLGVCGLGFVWLNFTGNLGTETGYARLIGIMGFRIIALISAVFSTAVIAGEVEQKTIVYLLTRPIPRPVLIIARALASVVTVAVIASLMVFVMGLMNFGLGTFTNGMVWRDVAAVSLGAGAYGGLFLFVSMLLNRAFLFCLLFAFGWEVFVPQMPGDLYFASIHSHMRALTLHPVSAQPTPALSNLTTGGADSAVGIPWGVALGTLLGCWILFTALSAVWFQNSEYVPREDAE